MVGLPFARAGNIKNGFQFSEGDKTDCFPIDSLDKVGFKISIPGDAVFTSKGAVGRFAFVREETSRIVYAPQLCFWRSGQQITKLLIPVGYSIGCRGESFLLNTNRLQGKPTWPSTSLRDQRRMHITLPQIDEQRSVAKILGAMDDRIELNRQMTNE